MRTNRTERTGPSTLSVAFGLGLAAGAVAIGLTASIAAPSVPECFEDEVAAWDGDEHTVCVPLDDLLADTVVVDVDYCTEVDGRGWILSCTVDPYATVPDTVALP